MQYFHLKGLSPTNIKTELDSTLGESAPSFTTIKYWVAEFKRGRTSYQDERRSGRPIEVTTPEMVKKESPQNGIGWPSTESARASKHSRHFKKCYTSYIDRKFGHKKAVRKMGVTFVHNGTKNNVMWMFQSSVWRCFAAIKPSFCIDSLSWMKHGSITSHLRRNNSQNNELQGENRLRRRRRQFHLLARS